MSEPATGLLFVPIPTGVPEWKSSLIRRTIEAVEDIPYAKIKEIHISGEDISRLHLSKQQLIDRMASSTRGCCITCENFGGFWPAIWFFRERPQAMYYPINIDVNLRAFSDIEGDPMKVEAFSAAWVHLCESLSTEAAYFSESYYTDPDLLINEGLDALQQEHIESFGGLDWRTYFSPRITAAWRERLDLSSANLVQDLPSGALLIAHGRGYNPQIGDRDALPNARFLQEQVEKQVDLPGASSLLDLLRAEEKRLIRIEDDGDYSKHREDAHYDYEGLRQARAGLDDVRATWACALQRPGLMGVQQPFATQANEVEVVVPVVADEGREWVLATLLYPYDQAEAARNEHRQGWSARERLARTSAAWNDAETGICARARRMLEAAQENLAHDEPPRIVVFCWRGVSPAIREELTAMGARVEVADRLPILEEGIWPASPLATHKSDK